MEVTPPLPDRIGRYDVQRLIGRGSMGLVYEARDPVLQRPVALKTIALAGAVTPELRAEFEKRFLQEARAAAALQHPGIVVVYEIGVDRPTRTPFMALEFLRGRTLEALLRQDGALEWRVALRVVLRLAEALEHAHSQGVVHRDIKPANIMLLPSGEPKIMDFGVAKLEASQLTSGGQVLGTPAYMAPEQALEARSDARSDVFSAGAVLYEAVTGRRAFGAPSLSAILLRLAHDEPPAPSTLVDGLPPALDAVVARALAKDPALRYASARALAGDLAALLAGTAPAAAEAPRPAAPAAREGERTAAGGGRPGLALPAGMRVSLALLTGTRAGEVLVLGEPSVLIGREGGGAGAKLELADPEVSRAHAVVECYGEQVLLRDLGSTNGTFVDGQRIRERALEDKGEFQVGSTRIMLIVAAAEQEPVR